MKFRVLRQAQREINAATVWYGDQRFGLGEEFLSELHTAYEFIQAHAELVPRLEQYHGPHLVRRQLLKRFPYLVVFVCRDAELLVVAVAHARRHPMYLLNRLT